MENNEEQNIDSHIYLFLLFLASTTIIISYYPTQIFILYCFINLDFFFKIGIMFMVHDNGTIASYIFSGIFNLFQDLIKFRE